MMLVRCDASEQWGMGNLMRCRALAQALHDEGVEMAMVGPGMDMQQAGDSKLFHHWFPMPWQEHAVDNAKQLLALSLELKAKVLVVDDPRANEAFQQVVYAAQIPWLQFDGTATQPIWANWVLNALPHTKASAYAEVVRNPSAQLLLGPQFAVLRKEFANAAQQQVHKNDGLRVLVTFGGGDDRGAIAWCLNALSPLLENNIQLCVISGLANPRNAHNLSLVQAMPPGSVDYCIQPEEPWSLMAAADLAVMASGTTVHEVNVFKLPTVLMSLVENQHKPGQAWAEALGTTYLGDWAKISAHTLLTAVQALVHQLQAATVQVPSLVDGLGASRVAKVLCAQSHR